MLADLTVLSQDVFTCSLNDLPETESVLTMVGGRIVWDAHALSLWPARLSTPPHPLYRRSSID